jgi:O-acetyl-ADP-ribose deacetylase (regulator of RNase III)
MSDPNKPANDDPAQMFEELAAQASAAPQRTLTRDPNTNGRTYHIGASTLTVVFGDLLRSRADILVSSDDYHLSMGGGVSAAIRSRAGEELEMEARKMAPAKLGDVIVTSAGRLGARYVLHAITIGPDYRDMPADAIVRQTVSRILHIAPLLGCRSVAFPVIGTGMAGIDFEVAAAEMAAAIASTLIRSPVPLDTEIYVIQRSSQPVEAVFGAFERHIERTLGLEAHADHGEYTLEAPDTDLPAAEGERDRRTQVHRMLTHLDARRDALESELVALLTSSRDAARIRRVRAQLEELKSLRSGYDTELSAETRRRAAANDATVFLSSTSQDLRPHRDSVRAAIEQMGLKFIGMEDFTPDESAPAQLIRRRVEDSSTYVGVIGLRYGYVEPSSGLSMTELEYRQAIASNKPMRIFLMHKDAQITAAMVETDPQSFAKLLAFRQHLETAHTCGYFMGPADLADKAAKALKND